MRLIDAYVVDTGFFLGVPLADWLKVLTATQCRKMTVLELVEQFEADHPNDYYAWKERHGVMAEVLELTNV